MRYSRIINELREFVSFLRYMLEKALSDLENENKIEIDKKKKPISLERINLLLNLKTKNLSEICIPPYPDFIS